MKPIADAVARLIEEMKAQGLGTYQAEYEAELQSGNDPQEENE